MGHPIPEGKTSRYDNRRINKDYLSEKISDFLQYFYICGPDSMVEDVEGWLTDLGADTQKIVREEF